MIVLFKEGTSHLYKGITCKMQIVDEFGFEPFLKQGWVLNPKDLYKDEEKRGEAKKEAEKHATSKASSTKDGLMSRRSSPFKPSMKTTSSGISAKK
jgi:hypothetical protein